MRLFNGVIRISFRTADFRIAFWQPFFLIYAVALFCSELLFVLSGNTALEVLLVVLPISVGALCSLAVLLIHGRFRFQISPTGIACYDCWRQTYRTAWDGISEVRFSEVVGLRYLKIVEKTSRKTRVIPMFVGNPSLFKEMLELYVYDKLANESLRQTS